MGNRIDDRGTRAIDFRGYSWEDPTGADSSHRHRTAIREPRSGPRSGNRDQVCDRDQVGVGYTMQPAISKAIAIKNDHPVCATHVQDCHLLARATRDRGCPRYGDRDRVVGFDWLTLNRVQFASKHTRVVLLPGRIFLASRRQRTSTLRTRRSLLELFGQECKNSHNPQLRLDAANLIG